MELAPTKLQDFMASTALLPVRATRLDRLEVDVAASIPAQATLGEATPDSPAAIMKACLSHVFCDADPEIRARTFELLWHSNPVIHRDEGVGVGRTAVLEIAARFAERMAGLTCAPLWPVSGHDGLYMLRWIAHRQQTAVATGSLIGLLVRDRIHALYMTDD